MCTSRGLRFQDAQRGARRQLWCEESPFGWPTDLLNLPCQKQNIWVFFSHVLLTVLLIPGYSTTIFLFAEAKNPWVILMLLFSLNFMFSLWTSWLHLPICLGSDCLWVPTIFLVHIYVRDLPQTAPALLSWSLASAHRPYSHTVARCTFLEHTAYHGISDTRDYKPHHYFMHYQKEETLPTTKTPLIVRHISILKILKCRGKMCTLHYMKHTWLDHVTFLLRIIQWLRIILHNKILNPCMVFEAMHKAPHPDFSDNIFK